MASDRASRERSANGGQTADLASGPPALDPTSRMQGDDASVPGRHRRGNVVEENHK
jgi:hypothetical protein